MQSLARTPQDAPPLLPYGIVCHPTWHAQIAGMMPPGIVVEHHSKHPQDYVTVCETIEAFGKVLREFEYGYDQP
jgi:hypothetical protein